MKFVGAEGGSSMKNIRDVRRENKGITVIEVVVGVALFGLVVIPILGSLFNTLFTVNEEQAKLSLNTSAKNAIDKIVNELRMTGPIDQDIFVYNGTTTLTEVTHGSSEQTGVILKIKNSGTSSQFIWYRAEGDVLYRYPASVSDANGSIPDTDKDKYRYLENLDTALVGFQITLPVYTSTSNKKEYDIAVNLKKNLNGSKYITNHLSAKYIKRVNPDTGY